MIQDTNPKLEEQAKSQGWEAGIFNFGKAEGQGVDYFNPGLVQREDGLWLIVRRSEIVEGSRMGKNSLWACKLNPDLTPHGGPMLKWKDTAAEEQMEDPRVVYHNGRTWIGACNFIWYGDSWTGAHQVLGVFDTAWQCLARQDPVVGGNGAWLANVNGRHEKNWVYFFHEGKLHLLYSAKPWKIVQFGAKFSDKTLHESEGIEWQWGQIRGGTPPVLHDGLYWTFFHSSMPWSGRYRRYYMGAVAFESKPPFKPVKMTDEPLLIGSQHDSWQERKPCVVFPCGAVVQDDKWLISYGINDLKSGWAKIPHTDLLSRMSAPGERPQSMDELLLRDNTHQGKPVESVVPSEPLPEKYQKGGDELCAAPVETTGLGHLSTPPNAPSTQEAACDAAVTFDPEVAAKFGDENSGVYIGNIAEAKLEAKRANMAKARAAYQLQRASDTAKKKHRRMKRKAKAKQ